MKKTKEPVVLRMKRGGGKPAEKFFQEFFAAEGILRTRMKRHTVIFEDPAQADVREWYDWPAVAWGKRKAQQWARQV